MSPTRILVAVLIASSTTLLACTAAPAPDDGEEASEETSSALANNGGGTGEGLTAAECKSCGCSLVFSHKDDSCRYYKCVCETEADAKCAGGKARLVSSPIPTRAITAPALGGAAVFAPR
jgi:hypothetical protein